MKTNLCLIFVALVCALAPARADTIYLINATTSLSGGTPISFPVYLDYPHGTTVSLSTGGTNGTLAITAGNVATATALKTARNINGVAFDGSGNITLGVTAASVSGTILTGSISGQQLLSLTSGATVTFVGSGNITLTTNSSSNTITIAETGSNSGTVTGLTGANGIAVSSSLSVPALSLPFTLAGGGGTLTISGSPTISGSNTLSLSSSGTLNLNGSVHTLSGSTTVSGSGLINIGANSLTLSGNTTIAGGGFTLTIPATGTAGLLGTAQTWSQLNTFSSTVTHTGALSTRTFSVGATGTTFNSIIMATVSASSGVATVTNAAITTTTIPVITVLTNAGTISLPPEPTMHSGSMSFNVTSTDTSTYSVILFVK